MATTTTFAQIEPTTRCNFSCGFCAGRYMRQGDLSWEHFERFLASHPDLRHVELQGEGEPLLHPRFFDMVSACRDRGIDVSLISNGSFLRPDKVDRLISSGVRSVHISLESADLETFRAIRGGDLSKVVAGVSMLMERRRDRGQNRPVVGFCVTILRRTLGDIHEIVSLYNSLGLDGGISVQLLQDMACYTDNYSSEMLAELVPKEQWRDYSWVVDAAIARAPALGDTVSFYGALFAGFDPSTGKCPWLERASYLSIDGKVTGCCFMKDPNHAFGDVMSDSPELIASRRSALAQALSDGEIPAPCTGCGVANAISRASEVAVDRFARSMAPDGHRRCAD